MIVWVIRALSMPAMMTKLRAVGAWSLYLFSLVPGLESRPGQEYCVGRPLQLYLASSSPHSLLCGPIMTRHSYRWKRPRSGFVAITYLCARLTRYMIWLHKYAIVRHSMYLHVSSTWLTIRQSSTNFVDSLVCIKLYRMKSISVLIWIWVYVRT